MGCERIGLCQIKYMMMGRQVWVISLPARELPEQLHIPACLHGCRAAWMDDEEADAFDIQPAIVQQKQRRPGWRGFQPPLVSPRRPLMAAQCHSTPSRAHQQGGGGGGGGFRMVAGEASIDLGFHNGWDPGSVLKARSFNLP